MFPTCPISSTEFNQFPNLGDLTKADAPTVSSSVATLVEGLCTVDIDVDENDLLEQMTNLHVNKPAKGTRSGADRSGIDPG